MRTSFRFEFLLLAVTLWACGGFGFYGQAQTRSPHCHEDGSPHNESGMPHCCADGSPPDGESQCWCDPQIVRGEYRNPKHEYEVHVPDGIAEILGCSGIGVGFKVSLDHPESGEGHLTRNRIAVSVMGGRETFQEMIDAWHRLKEDSERDPNSGQQFNEPEQTSLSSLPALRFKSARTEPESGRIIVEEIIAKNPDKDIVYSIMIITPTDQYEKNEKLFKEIVDGFRYAPAGQHSLSNPEQTAGSSQRGALRQRTVQHDRVCQSSASVCCFRACLFPS